MIDTKAIQERVSRLNCNGFVNQPEDTYALLHVDIPNLLAENADLHAQITALQEAQRERELMVADRAYDQGRFDECNALPARQSEEILDAFNAQEPQS